MNIQKKTETSALELMAVVFSLHPAVQTKVYAMVASPIAGQVKLAKTPLPDSTTFPAHITDTRHLLQQCQRLLYSVYYSEMGWRPNSKAHTQFEIREEEQLFCDRYDETAIWTVQLTPKLCHLCDLSDRNGIRIHYKNSIRDTFYMPPT